MAYDINKILAEYGDDDFGFSAVSEEDYNAVINEKADTVNKCILYLLFLIVW